MATNEELLKYIRERMGGGAKTYEMKEKIAKARGIKPEDVSTKSLGALGSTPPWAFAALPVIGSIFGGPLGGKIGSAVAGGLSYAQSQGRGGSSNAPKAPEYEQSPTEKKYQEYLEDILEGKSGYTPEQRDKMYQSQKESLLPEYDRLREEYAQYAARRGIEGGAASKYEQRLGAAQISDLTKIRQQIENDSTKLQLQLQQYAMGGLGQLGTQQSMQQYNTALLNYQQLMNQYNQQQQALSELYGVGLNLGYDVLSNMDWSWLTGGKGTSGTGGTTFPMNVPQEYYGGKYQVKPIGL